MKKIYFSLLAVLGLSMSAEAQRTLTLTLSIKYPSLDTNLTTGITVRPQYVIKNVSATAADSICTGDTIYFRTPANTLASGSKPNSGLIFGGTIRRGDSIILNKATVTGPGTDYEMDYSQIETLLDLPGVSIFPKTGFTANTQYQWYFQVLAYAPSKTKPALSGPVSVTNTNAAATVRVWNKKGTAISELTADNAIKTYPNPAANQISFEAAVSGTVTASIVDIAGRTLATQAFSNSTSGKYDMDITSVPSGIYFLRIAHDGEAMMTKFNVQK